MCGIAGRFHPHSLPPDTEWPIAADRLLAHRGPDGCGHFLDGNCELVHRRLALLDLSPTGSQPLCNHEKTVYVVFNGEIYNHRELRAELLSRGYRFSGTSDTEVLVHLYSEYGPAMVEKLEGMFAFAIYDRRACRLLLARDRFGIKPLFYAQAGEQWIFASEIKAIAAAAGFTPTLDRQACYDFLGMSYLPGNQTGFREIQSLAKGSTIEIEMSGARHREYYKPVPRPDDSLRIEDAVVAAGERILESVNRQSVADVPVAALLSGGIDSGLIVAAYSQTGRCAGTFTVQFPDAAYDESEAAASVAGHCGTVHHMLPASDWDLSPETVCDLVEHFDQPFADTSFIPMYNIATAVRQRGFICTLSGDGGDEVFGGYARFPRANVFHRLMSLPTSLLASGAVAGDVLANWTRDRGRQMSKAMRMAISGQRDRSTLIAQLSSYMSEPEKEQLVGARFRSGLAPGYRHFNGVPPDAGKLDDLSRHMTSTLFSVSLPGDMLRKVDMMSMRASIEVRVPMLDEQVVQLGLRLPHRLKTDGRKAKLVLRELAAKWLPRRVAGLPKHGFTIPLDRLLPASFDDMLRDTLLAPSARIRNVFDAARVERWLDLFQRSRAGRPSGQISREGVYQRLFILLSLELWMRRYRLAW
jgi:asparagine synthase (glutamine-hydrolysing)